MKKLVKRMGVCALLFVTVFMLTGCSKKAITAETFKSKMTSNGYQIIDATSEYYSGLNIKKAYIAIKSDGSYQVEFYELDNKNDAVSMFENNKNIFVNSKASVSSDSSINGSNFKKYTLSTGGKYKVVCQVDNTFLYLDIPSEKKDQVKKDLEDLGY